MTFSAILIILALIPWGMLIVTSGRGFDITDESFYLLNYSAAQNVTATFTFFGAFGKPFYDLMGGSIVGIRLAGIILWFIIAVGVSWVTLKLISRRAGTRFELSLDRHDDLLLFILTAGAATYYHLWLTTPSYNWFALIGLGLFWAGLLMWLAPNLSPRITSVGAFLFAFSAAVVFWSKISSAAFLVLFVIAGLFLQWRDRRRLLAAKTVLSGFIGFALGFIIPLFTVPIQNLIPILMRGIEHKQMLTSASGGLIQVSLTQFFGFFIGNPFILNTLVIWFLILLILLIILRRPNRYKGLAQRVLLFALIMNLLYNTLVTYPYPGYWTFNVLLSVALCLALGQYAQNGYKNRPNLFRWLRSALWAIPISLLLFVYIFGTDDGYVNQSDLGAFFFLLSTAVLFVIVPDTSPIKVTVMRITTPIVLVTVILSMIYGSFQPERQFSSIWAMHDQVSLSNNSQSLTVGAAMAHYIDTLQTVASEAHFQPGTPIIDMTGHSLGAVYILNGQAPVYPWLPGGYPGSDAVASYILHLWSRPELDAAWILTGVKNGNQNLSLSALTGVGLDFPAGYQLVGTVTHPDGTEVQGLWKPTSTNP